MLATFLITLFTVLGVAAVGVAIVIVALYLWDRAEPKPEGPDQFPVER